MAGKKHFNGLDELRALCALGVVFFHTESVKAAAHLANLASLQFTVSLGANGVLCFFVLSGFLVSYLLLQEQREYGAVSLSRFYLNRFIRIAPLYYLVFLFAFFVFRPLDPLPEFQNPELGYGSESLLLHFLFLPQVALEKVPFLMGATQLWSIGLEVQFYLIWPLYFKAFQRFFPWAFAPIYFWYYFYRLIVPLGSSASWLDAYILRVQIIPMIVGAFAGWLVFARREKILKFLFHPWVQLFSYFSLGACYLFFVPGHYAVFRRFPPEPFLFSVLIMNLAANPRCILKGASSFLRACGQFSYGIYLYHVFFVHLMVGWAVKTGFLKDSPFCLGVFLHAAIYSLTLALAFLSFRYLERPLVRWARHHVSWRGAASIYSAAN